MKEERVQGVLRCYTTSELAALGNVDQSRIRQLLLDGTLEGEKRGRDWFVFVWSAQQWLEGRRDESGVA